MTFKLPQLAAADEYLVVHVAATGDDQQPGTADQPVKTMHKALEITRAKQKGKEIRLRDGEVIPLATPLQLDARDSGLRIICQKGMATISGGLPVVDWKLGEDGLWRAKCPTAEKPRELFVNNRRATRARYPNEGWLRIEQSLPDRRSGFTFNAEDLPAEIEAGNGLELVFLHDWSMSRIAVAQIDRDTHTLRTADPVGCNAPHYAIDHFEKQPRYALEGSAVLIDAPGEWALDGDELLYKPLPAEDIAKTTAVVPHLTQLLQIAPGNDKEQPTDIYIEGIAWKHCRFDLPPHGYASGQATMHERRDGSGKNDRPFIPAAARIAGASIIHFYRGEFAQLGGSGLWIGENSRLCQLDECTFTDISANGINLGEQGTNNVAKEILIENSVVTRCGSQFFGSVGIWIGMAESCVIADCEISELPYTGISVGWRWNPTPSPCQKHQISGNHIHHVMQVLSDGGGIYTLGRQPGTVLKSNHIHDVPLNAGRAQSNGIFMDEGSTDMLVEKNVIHAIAKSPIRFHKAGENIIRDNVLGISPDATDFTFNATDAKVIHFENNHDFAEGSAELQAAVEGALPKK